jgi:hypothetical protein
MVVAMLALFVALGGSVYAAKKGKIPGTAIKVKSLPANRLKPHSVGSAQIKPGTFSGSELQPGSITGAQINEATLGQVPTAQYADNANSALDAQTALNAVNAVNAEKVNGHTAGCLPSTQFFAGACWQSNSSAAAATSPEAATICASLGGTLPDPFELAAFAKRPGVTLDAGSEWTSDIINYSGGPYGVATVSPTGVIGSGVFNPSGPSDTHKYRCVVPLVT